MPHHAFWLPIWRGSRCGPPANAAEPDARFGQCKGGIFGGDDQVASQRRFKAAAHRHAIDGRDRRLVAIEREVSPAKPLVFQPFTRRRLAISGRCRLRRPVARAGDDRHPLLRVGANASNTSCSSKCASGEGRS